MIYLKLKPQTLILLRFEIYERSVIVFDFPINPLTALSLTIPVIKNRKLGWFLRSNKLDIFLRVLFESSFN